MKKRLLPFFAALGLAACGGPDNVATCKSFVQSAKCGSVDISTQVNCDAYANTSCDISGYFDCLKTKYVCTSNGTYDTTKLATVGDCTAQATCH